MERVPLALLAEPAWALRDNLGLYDALYVALAQMLDCELITADRRIATAPPTGVTIKLVTG